MVFRAIYEVFQIGKKNIRKDVFRSGWKSEPGSSRVVALSHTQQQVLLFFFLLIIRLPPEFLPVLGLTEQ